MPYVDMASIVAFGNEQGAIARNFSASDDLITMLQPRMGGELSFGTAIHAD